MLHITIVSKPSGRLNTFRTTKNHVREQKERTIRKDDKMKKTKPWLYTNMGAHLQLVCH